MKPKSTLILDNEFIQYCELNNIKDINKTAQETFNRGFSLLKYGETPIGNSTVVEVVKEVIVEKEVIVDREIRVPYEVIKEVRVEVPVEIIKEVTLQGETIVNEVVKEIINTQEVDRLTIENNRLKEELNKITTSLESLNKNIHIKNTENKSLYDE
jgi:16S rRNA C1402 (ribose-2'-O) methylase RsmI